MYFTDLGKINFPLKTYFRVKCHLEIIYNPIYQKLIDENDYFTIKCDKRVYLDLRASPWYMNEVEKLERNDWEINLHLLLKATAKKSEE